MYEEQQQGEREEMNLQLEQLGNFEQEDLYVGCVSQ
jgi:hypothetical protein